MGLEVGWQLRFTKASRVEVIVLEKVREALYDQAVTVGGWHLETTPLPGDTAADGSGLVKGVFTRLPLGRR